MYPILNFQKSIVSTVFKTNKDFLKKGAYCFAPVGRLVCRPSDVHSKSLVTPLLERSQTWYSGCLWRVNVQVTWSKVEVNC